MRDNIFDSLNRDALRHLLGFFDIKSLNNLALTNKSNNEKVQDFKLFHLANFSPKEQMRFLEKIFFFLSQRDLNPSEKEFLKTILLRYNFRPAPSLAHVARGLICLSYCKPLDEAQIRRLLISLKVLAHQDRADIDYLVSMLVSKNIELWNLIRQALHLRLDESLFIPKKVLALPQRESELPFPEDLEARKQWTLAQFELELAEKGFARTVVSGPSGYSVCLLDGVKSLTQLIRSEESKSWAINLLIEKIIPSLASESNNYLFDDEKNPLLRRLIQLAIEDSDESQRDLLLEACKKLVLDLFNSRLLYMRITNFAMPILVDLIHNVLSREFAIRMAIENFTHLFRSIEYADYIPSLFSNLFLEMFKSLIEYADNEELVELNKKFLSFSNPQDKRAQYRSHVLIFPLLLLILKKIDPSLRYSHLESVFGAFLCDSQKDNTGLSYGKEHFYALNSAVNEFGKMLVFLSPLERKNIFSKITHYSEPLKSMSYEQALLLKVSIAYADEEDVNRILSIFSYKKTIGIPEGILVHQLCLLDKFPLKESDRFITKLLDTIDAENAVVNLQHAESSTYALLAYLIVKFEARGAPSLAHKLLRSLNKVISDFFVVRQALLTISILLPCLTPESAGLLDHILQEVCAYLRAEENEKRPTKTELFLKVFNAIYSRKDFNLSEKLVALMSEDIASSGYYFTSRANLTKTAEILLEKNENAIPLSKRLLFPSLACNKKMLEPILSHIVYQPKQDYSEISFFIGLFSNINSERALLELMRLIRKGRSRKIRVELLSFYCKQVTEVKHFFLLLDFTYSPDVFCDSWFIEERHNGLNYSFVSKFSYNHKVEVLGEALLCSSLIRDRIQALNNTAKLPSNVELLIRHFLVPLEVGVRRLDRASNLEFIFWCIQQCHSLEALREFRYAIFESKENRRLFAFILNRQTTFSLRWHEYQDSNGQAHETSFSAVRIIQALQAQMQLISERPLNPEPLTEIDRAFLRQTGSGFSNPSSESKCSIC